MSSGASSVRRRALLLLVGTLLVAAVACGKEPEAAPAGSADGRPVREEGSGAAPAAAPGAGSAPAPDRLDPGGCVRVGDTRQQVRDALGGPDSVSFGRTWMYGEASLTFDAYGVVESFVRPGARVRRC